MPTVRALIERTGPGFSIVIASRSTPRLPLGRLRARGAVSRIGGDALCFDVPETDRLFRDAYHLPIEPDVVDELVERTEGWAALLSLVNVGLGEQTRRDPRAFVAQISANQGDLYDFLAEEVVASLATDLHCLSHEGVGAHLGRCRNGRAWSREMDPTRDPPSNREGRGIGAPR